MNRLLLAGLLATLALPAIAQDAEPAPAPETPAAASEVDTEQAESISNEIFGPRAPVDLAYGAYQRGYYLTAFELALPRAEQGDPAAQTLIAEIYALGQGVPQDPVRAASWYQLAVGNGDPLAAFALALYYQQGVGVPKDRERAARLFSQAATSGYPPAKYNMALLHVEGLYAPPSLTTAAALMREAAEADLPEAQYDYGTMLIEGAGLAPNDVEGARFIGLAAEQGLVEAQVDYATLLYLGQGVDRDVPAAAEWYRRAAEAGNAVAQNRYAKLLAVGEGVAADLETAAMYRALARRQGLTDEDLDRLLVAVPADQLAAAEERARFWPSFPPGDTEAAAEPVAPAGEVLPAPTDAGEAPTAAQTVDAGPPPAAPAPESP